MHKLKGYANVLLSLLSMLYPFLLYFGRDALGVWVISLCMTLAWALRALFAVHRPQRILALVCTVFFGLQLIQQSASLMYWYPVMVSAILLTVFTSSLWAEQTLIERLARLKEPELSPQGAAYTRRLTKIWCLFFMINILITSVLILLKHWHLWMVYTGVISYLLMGLLFVGEWLYRRFILHKHEQG